MMCTNYSVALTVRGHSGAHSLCRSVSVSVSLSGVHSVGVHKLQCSRSNQGPLGRSSSLSVCLSVCLSLSLFLSQVHTVLVCTNYSVALTVRGHSGALSLCRSVCLSVCLSLSLPPPSVCLPNHPSLPSESSLLYTVLMCTNYSVALSVRGHSGALPLCRSFCLSLSLRCTRG